MNNLLWHLSAFLVAVIMSVVTIFIGQNLLKSTIYDNQLAEGDFVYKTDYGVNKAINIAILQHYLSAGRIVVFGSSELTADHQKYIPYNFFNQHLGTDLTAFGHAGQQSFAILSQLIAYYNEDMHNNARIVILLSPGWFKYSGTSIQSFIEYMPQKLLETLYFESQIDEEYKLWVSHFLKYNIHKLKQPNSIHYIVASYNPDHHLSNLLQSLPYKMNFLVKGMLFGNEYNISKKTSQARYKSVNTDWENLLKDAIEKESNLVTTNNFGINDVYFDQYVKPEIREGKFPFETGSIAKAQENAEYQDFLKLVKFSKLFKTKPLFVILPLNPHAYKELENYHDILTEIKHILESEGFKYLDMWPWNQHDYVKGRLTDAMHTGEVGWVQINKAIYDYFINQAR